MSDSVFRPTAAACAAAVFALGALHGLPARAAEQVVITGSIAERAVLDAPYAVGVVERETLREAGPQINLSEALSRVPGLVVANRSNYAQDLQISSRGFGARAGFGVRGLRLLADGIPATGPDGQGQVSQFDLAGAERIEVLRGPFSVLYGNASGGVISLVSAPVTGQALEGEGSFGSFGLQQLRAGASMRLSDALDARVGLSEMSIAGFRPQSAAQRRLASGRLGWQAGGGAHRVTVSASALTQPADDPLGLSRAQFDADPLQTTPQAAQFRTRKDTDQQQWGASGRHRLDAGVLREAGWMVYRGQRSVTQFLAIAPATQNNPRHGGGVIDFDRDFSGAELRARLAFGDRLELQLGAALDEQRDERRGYENYVGTGAAQQLGVQGRLRRDETNRARSRDVFGQAEWAVSPAVGLSAGVRSGRVTLSAADRFLGNGDDSGAVAFDYTNPVLGLRWQPAPGWTLHASAARGFESPTLGEIAYRPDQASGLNLALQAQTSRQAELGLKWRGRQADLDLALFEARVANEIAVASNFGGRASFQNVGRTLRRGVELAGGWAPAPGWQLRGAATWLDASYRDPFLACAGIGCTAPTVPVAPGGQIAGTARTSGFADLAWTDARWGRFGLEWRASGRTAVNDLNSDFAGGWSTVSLRWSRTLVETAGQRVELLLRVDNVGDRRYAGSVIVNEANARFFETAAPRNLLLALRIEGR